MALHREALLEDVRLLFELSGLLGSAGALGLAGVVVELVGDALDERLDVVLGEREPIASVAPTRTRRGDGTAVAFG